MDRMEVASVCKSKSRPLPDSSWPEPSQTANPQSRQLGREWDHMFLGEAQIQELQTIKVKCWARLTAVTPTAVTLLDTVGAVAPY